jgi:hypothetical protein
MNGSHMKVTVHRTGGFGGLRVGGTVDSEDLPSQLARRVEERLRPDSLAAAERHHDAIEAVDDFTYEVDVESGSRTYEIAGASSNETAAVLGELVNEIMRRRR